MASSLDGSVATKRHRRECRPRCPRTISVVSFRDIHQCPSEQILQAEAMELLTETELFLGCMYERKRLWMHFRFLYLRAEETMNLTNLPEYISAIVAIIALLISCYQARLSNKQSLFNRRLNIWITVDKLMCVYVINAKDLEHDDEPQMAIGLLFEWLTNTTYLQSISASINHVLDADPQLKLHLKLDEMKSLAMEARFCFKGKSGDAIAEFIEAYHPFCFQCISIRYSLK